MSLYLPVHPVPKTILFLARSLDRGGAERQLVVLAKGLVRRGHSVAVALSYGGGVYEAELLTTGVRGINLEKKGRWDLLPFLRRLVLLVRQERPNVLHSYLGLPNILAAALKPLVPSMRIVWSVRASNVDLSRYDWLARVAYALECRLARFADLIIANSRAGKNYAAANGFPEDKVMVIPNGIDTKYFRFDPVGRRFVRSVWGLDKDVTLVGLVARFDPIKDHPNFLQAASSIARRRHDVYFVCVGDGPAAYAEALKQQAETLGLNGRLIWAGARDDMPAVYSALDVACSSSIGEGFSNTIAEAMACGVPCVVTDVGDSAFIVGEAASVVAPADCSVFAGAIERLTDLSHEERQTLGATSRTRVVSEFGIDRLIQRTEKALDLV